MTNELFQAAINTPAYNNLGEQTTLSKLPWRYLGLYFTASWCGACHSFGKYLRKFYQNANSTSRNMQILNISLDNTMEEFNQYGKIYPWWTLKFDGSSNHAYMNGFQVGFMPTLLVFDRTGKIVSRNGVGDLRKAGDRALDLWEGKQDDSEY